MVEIGGSSVGYRTAVFNGIADLQTIGCKARYFLAPYHDTNDSVVAVGDNRGAVVVVCARGNGSRRGIRNNQESDKE